VHYCNLQKLFILNDFAPNQAGNYFGDSFEAARKTMLYLFSRLNDRRIFFVIHESID
jgi:hypothetical protein